MTTFAHPTSGEVSASRHSTPEYVIHGGRSGLSLHAIREIWAYREVFQAFTVRLVKVKYKQAAVGVGWAVLQPVLSAVIFAVFLGRIAHIASEGGPYLLFALVGMVAWTYFSGAASRSMDILVGEQGLLRKVYFPREILPFAAVAAALVDLLPGIGVLLVAVLAYGRPLHWTWLAVPIPIVILVLAATALGLGVSGLNVYYRDVRYVLPFVIQLGLFGSPVIYSLQQVPAGYRSAYAVLNPVAAGIDGLRRTMLHGQWPDPLVSVGALAWCLVLLMGGYTLFKRLERGFADRV